MAGLFVSGIGFNAEAIRTLEEVNMLAANTINADRTLINVLDPNNTLGFRNTTTITFDQASQLLDAHRESIVPRFTKKNKTIL